LKRTQDEVLFITCWEDTFLTKPGFKGVKEKKVGTKEGRNLERRKWINGERKDTFSGKPARKGHSRKKGRARCPRTKGG